MPAITLAECHQCSVGRKSRCCLQTSQTNQGHYFDAFQLRVWIRSIQRPYRKGEEQSKTTGGSHPNSGLNVTPAPFVALSDRIDAGQRSCRSGGLKRSYKAIAALGNCLDESRLLRRIAQSFPEPSNRAVQAMIKVDKCISRPKFFTQLLPRYHFTGLLHQQ